MDMNIKVLRKKISQHKVEYSTSMKNLETISDQIHEAKRLRKKSSELMAVPHTLSTGEGKATCAGNSCFLQVPGVELTPRRASEPINLHKAHSDVCNTIHSTGSRKTTEDNSMSVREMLIFEQEGRNLVRKGEAVGMHLSRQ